MTFQAQVISTKDPEKKNRVKLRVIGVHPGDLPESQLPWTQIQPGLGSNSGQGTKAALQKGQYCEVKSLDKGCTEFIVTSGSVVYKQEKSTSSSKRTNYVKESETKNEDLKSAPVPFITSTDLAKLKDTAQGLMNSKLIGAVSGALGGPTTEDPVPPTGGWPINAKNIDLRQRHNVVKQFPNDQNSIQKYVVQEKKEQHQKPGTVKEQTVDLTNVDVEIVTKNGKIKEKNNKDVTGYDYQSQPDLIKIHNNLLYIPGNILYNQSVGYSEYTIYYTAKSRAHPGNTSQGEITFTVGDVNHVPYPPDAPPQGTAITPQGKVDEIPKTSEKGQTENKECNQLPNGIVIETDGSKDNINYSISHPKGARVEISHEGSIIIKGTDQLQLLTPNGKLETVAGSVVTIVDGVVNIKCSVYYLTANKMVIDGDLDISGDIVAKGEVTGKGIQLSTHKHQHKTPNTSKPI